MSPVTHFLAGWLLANTVSLSRRERAAVVVAAVVPDVDGMGALPELLTRNSAHPLMWFSQYHHSLHTVAFALAVTLATFVIVQRRWTTALMVFLSFHLHLLGDLLGARGPDGYSWPIPYLMPFSNSVQLSWSGQWTLNSWPNVAITVVFLVTTLFLAWKSGKSPLEFVSATGNTALVSALRQRFPVKPKQTARV